MASNFLVTLYRAAARLLEETGAPYASQTKGLMHACGHDGHTAMLLAAAQHLATHRNFDGTVYLIFQPAEEGGGGGREMVNDGMMDRFKIEEFYGLHNMPGIPAGQFGIKTGGIMVIPVGPPGAQHILKVLKAIAEYHDLSLGDLIEGDPLGGARPDGASCQQAEEPLQVLPEPGGMSRPHHVDRVDVNALAAGQPAQHPPPEIHARQHHHDVAHADERSDLARGERADHKLGHAQRQGAHGGGADGGIEGFAVVLGKPLAPGQALGIEDFVQLESQIAGTEQRLGHGGLP